MSKTISAFLLCLVCAFWLVSCDRAAVAGNSVLPEDEVIAWVNEEKLRLDDFQKEVREFIDRFPQIRPELNHNLNEVEKVVLNRMIEEKLILQTALHRNFDMSQEQWIALIDQALYAYPGFQSTYYLQQLEISNQKWSRNFKHNYLIQRIVEEEVNQRIQIKESELLDYYNKNKREFTQKKQIEVWHIQTNTKTQADNARKKLLKGEKFVNVVQEYSVAADRTQQGHLGFVGAGVLPNGLEKAIFKLSSKTPLSPVVKSDFGYHIFRWQSTIEPRAFGFEEARELIKGKLWQKKVEQTYQSWLNNLKSRASIRIEDRLLTPVNVPG